MSRGVVRGGGTRRPMEGRGEAARMGQGEPGRRQRPEIVAILESTRTPGADATRLAKGY